MPPKRSRRGQPTQADDLPQSIQYFDVDAEAAEEHHAPNVTVVGGDISNSTLPLLPDVNVTAPLIDADAMPTLGIMDDPETNHDHDLNVIVTSPSALLASEDDSFVQCTACAKPLSSLSLFWFTHQLASEQCRGSPGRLIVTEGTSQVECLVCHRLLSVLEQQSTTHKRCVAKHAEIVAVDVAPIIAFIDENPQQGNDDERQEAPSTSTQQRSTASSDDDSHLSSCLLAELLSSASASLSSAPQRPSHTSAALMTHSAPSLRRSLSEAHVGGNTFYCSACNVDVNGKENWQAHLVGAKHRKSIRAILDVKITSTALRTAPASEQQRPEKRARSSSPPPLTIPPPRPSVSGGSHFIGSIPGVVMPTSLARHAVTNSLPVTVGVVPAAPPQQQAAVHFLSNLPGVHSSATNSTPVPFLHSSKNFVVDVDSSVSPPSNARRVESLRPPDMPFSCPSSMASGLTPPNDVPPPMHFVSEPRFISGISCVKSAAEAASQSTCITSKKGKLIQPASYTYVAPPSNAPPRVGYLMPPGVPPSCAISVVNGPEVMSPSHVPQPVQPASQNCAGGLVSEPRFISGISCVKSAAEAAAQNTCITSKKGKLLQPASYTYVAPPSNAPPRVGYLMPPGASGSR